MIGLAASAARTSCTSESRLIVSFPVLWPARTVREGEALARQSPARRSRTSGRANDRVQGYRQDQCGLGGLVRSRVGVTCRAPRGPGRPGAKSPTPGLRLVRSLRTTSSGPSRALRPAGAIKGQLSRSVTPQTLRDRKQLLTAASVPVNSRQFIPHAPLWSSVDGKPFTGPIPGREKPLPSAEYRPAAPFRGSLCAARTVASHASPRKSPRAGVLATVLPLAAAAAAAAAAVVRIPAAAGPQIGRAHV